MSQLQIIGNELNGYAVQIFAFYSWNTITKRFKTYQEAVEILDNIKRELCLD